MKKRLFMVAGEASADMHAASLLKELKNLNPEIECFGVGGPELRRTGMDIILESEKLNVVGISDWFDRMGEVLGGYRSVIKSLKSAPPDLAVLIDLPDFNLRVAKTLKRLGVPVIYYISPQVWAWRKYRINQIRRDVDLMMVVFPFEKEFYAKEGVEVAFVGHPLLESIRARSSYRNGSEIKIAPRVALLPGSRRSEVKFHAQVIVDLAQKIFEKYPKAQLRVPVAQTLSKDFVQEQLKGANIKIEEENSHHIIEWADVAVVASGTATLETALIGTPFALFYKVSSTSAWIYKKLVRFNNFIGMPNLLQNREVVKEFFQEEATPQNLFLEVDKLIQDETYRLSQSSSLLDCRKKLGDEGASLKAARNVYSFITKGPNGEADRKGE
ncbi:MAG: lipid-A-disaccharide synthase [Deltaproteobacteria bacterium]|nr:lipid-A-disaccharide synthase [Deltaproteobacteria bacterium]